MSVIPALILFLYGLFNHSSKGRALLSTPAHISQAHLQDGSRQTSVKISGILGIQNTKRDSLSDADFEMTGFNDLATFSRVYPLR